MTAGNFGQNFEDVHDAEDFSGFHVQEFVDWKPGMTHALFDSTLMTYTLLRVMINKSSDDVVFIWLNVLKDIIRITCQID